MNLWRVVIISTRKQQLGVPCPKCKNKNSIYVHLGTYTANVECGSCGSRWSYKKFKALVGKVKPQKPKPLAKKRKRKKYKPPPEGTFCVSCGSELGVDWKFCGKCGTKI